MKTVPRGQNPDVVRTGNQAMAVYQAWRRRMVNRRHGLTLPPRAEKKQEPAPTG